MYITKVKLEDVRCFKKLELNFRTGRSRNNWIMLTGNNGEGKTTVLRSIAMGLCDETSAAGLLRELSGTFIRDKQKKATITLEFIYGSKRYTTVTTIKDPDVQWVSQKTYVGDLKSKSKGKRVRLENFPWNDVFVCGYGAGRGEKGTFDYSEYYTVDSVYSLFKYEQPLQNPELAYRRYIYGVRQSVDSTRRYSAETKAHKEITALLSQLLMLDEDTRIRLSEYGIVSTQGKKGLTLPLGALGDGYRATLTWVLDVISWWLMYSDFKSPNLHEMTGIVLLDEIEQHLHPRWQREIMLRLKSQFPKLQFICSTHSPLVLSGCEDMAIHSFSRGSHRVVDAYGWRAEDVYREVMGLPTSRAKSYESGVINRLQELHLKSLKGRLSQKEKYEMKRLEQELLNLPGADPVASLIKLKNLGTEF